MYQNKAAARDCK